MGEWERRRISDEELRELVQKAIASGISRTRFHDDLRGNRIAVGVGRLSRMWDEFDGPLQDHRGGWI